MIGFKIDTAKSLFFDSARVLRALDRAEARVLSRMGAFIRTTAQRSMRPGGKKRKRSAPGEPPRAHGDKLLRKFLFFVYEPTRKSVVIGPALLNGRAKRNHGKTIPETLESGGQVDTLEVLYKGQWRNYWDEDVPATARLFNQKRNRTATVQKRPYMKPAYDKEMPRFMNLWRDAMNKAA